jgi:UDP-N-acetylglucosamine 1-carboxyvinyltransferase
MQENKKIGAFIEDIREKRGITQEELARMLKTSQSAVARMEAGRQNFTTEMLGKISSALESDIITLPTGSVNFEIEGGHKLSGTIVTKSAKNSAVALLCGSLLNRGKTVLKSMPRIEEVHRIIEVLQSIGVSARWINENDVEIVPPKKITLSKMDAKAAVRTRSVLLLLGPLVHLLPHFSLPHPGGCKLGKRSVRPHFFALAKLGVDIKTVQDFHRVKVGKLKPAEIVLYESGDTVTENALMAAAKIPGATVIKYASANYQVQDLCHFLKTLGIEVEGVGTTTLTVHGKSEIDENIEFHLTEDPIESMFFIAAAATTNSSIIIERCPIDFLELELLKLEKMGFRYKILKRYKSANGFANLADIKTFPSSLVALEEKIYARPYPGLNIDNLPFFMPIATRARGTTLIHDWTYEDRIVQSLELRKLGAIVILADQHRMYIEGPTKLKSADIMCPPVLRVAAILLIAMLAADGTSILRNIYSIARGYEDLANRLNKLGAKIKVLKGM